MELTITVVVEDVKAVEACVESAQDWLQKAWDGKANSCVEKIVDVFATTNPKTMLMDDMRGLIKTLTFEPFSEERQAKDLSERLEKN